MGESLELPDLDSHDASHLVHACGISIREKILEIKTPFNISGIPIYFVYEGYAIMPTREKRTVNQISAREALEMGYNFATNQYVGFEPSVIGPASTIEKILI